MDKVIKCTVFEHAKNNNLAKFVGVNDISELDPEAQSYYGLMMTNVQSAYELVEEHVDKILAELTDTTTNLNAVETDLTTVRGKLAAAEADLKTVRDELARVKTELDNANNDLAAANTRADQLNIENAKLTDIVSKRDAEIKGLMTANTAAGDDNVKLTNAIADLESEIRKLKASPSSTKYELFGKFVMYYTTATKNNETSRKILGSITECYTTNVISIECAISCMSLVAGQAASDPGNCSACIKTIARKIKGYSIPFILIRDVDVSGNYGIVSVTTMITSDDKNNITAATTAHPPYINDVVVKAVKNLK